MKTQRFRLLVAMLCLGMGFAWCAQAGEEITRTLTLVKGEDLARLGEFLQSFQGGINSVETVKDEETGGLTCSVRGYPKPRKDYVLLLPTPDGAETRSFSTSEEADRYITKWKEEQKTNSLRANESQVLQVQYADVNQVAEMLCNVLLPEPSKLRIAPNEGTGKLMVWGSPDLVEMVKKLVEQMDVPPTPKPKQKNFRIIGYLIEATEEDQGGEVPEALQPVVAELQETFVYRHYNLLDTMILLCREEETAETSGRLPSGDESPASCTFRVQAPRFIPEEGGGVISLSDLRLDYEVQEPDISQTPGVRAVVRAGERRSFGIQTGVDLRPGQTVVVGKSRVENNSDALFLVMSAEVVD